MSFTFISLLILQYVVITGSYLWEGKYADAVYWIGAIVVTSSFLLRR